MRITPIRSSVALLVVKLKSGWVELKVRPGFHEVRNFFPASKEEKYLANEGEWRLYSHTAERRQAEPS